MDDVVHMAAIQQYFRELTDISDQDLLLFCSKLQRAEFPRKSVILESGKTENYLSFIEKGILRFNIPKPDYDLTFAFAFENAFVSAYDSFLTRKSCLYNVEAISDCVLWQISYTDLNGIYENTRIGDRIGRKVAENIYLKKMKREISLLEDTAKQRYLDLIREQPELIRNIPLKYLASYIGVRPQSLSRIRKQIC
ncbi:MULTISPECIES: Crp/Fnr family transcriptional regulator [Chryseobacterium]|uniref:CRP-like cAMP-binding protein n=1 Tax=Chryseobacterium camelliae TaxID=1265445 RepID=A0ABU0THR6_9FLAO|nr:MULTISPECIES: Crp/Fnr family transcriptional regulator [Chryseobacterium]MDT3409624.1 CRP-like cAMP-binding protein [Pseudacidovorax intermedius]MDQ1096516.1 CRP-like cAMP-binding protein [Chryseobacterium camelliae]MDQ1100456.1 CRP-like cAMP-binding protein [Chryseobacterium sp. SORGH_AS_1048]MDR6087797.1 CRP-like cAMP-binding protein [Chryseobacterium sp. SORGH_AS_0909]MDR6132172.1 CRP-like cAMP-binding protein [Chryseobacterium sp. SORGH_AS_1175]